MDAVCVFAHEREGSVLKKEKENEAVRRLYIFFGDCLKNNMLTFFFVCLFINSH